MLTYIRLAYRLRSQAIRRIGVAPYNVSIDNICNTGATRHGSTGITQQTSVLIVGGGPTGLLLSALLSQFQTPSVLIEARHPEIVARHPQAHYINLRSMEILRHNFPNLYHNVIQNMPPSREWNAFTFSHSILGRQIARVVHPVENLKVGQDGNGIVTQEKYTSNVECNMETGERCSPCHTPGHLAQNIFSTLLLNEARDSLKRFSNSHPVLAEKDRADIIHGVTVTNIVDHGSHQGSHPISVHTSCGRHFQAKYLVAADGSSSLIRSLYGDPNKMVGEKNIQHLINVHFQTSPSLSALLMKHHDRIGMLHFVYNSNLVGAFVCHNLQQGEWVLQIPFFPPFDSVDDFTEENVRFLIKSGIFGYDSNDIADADLKILHVKPWNMSSLVSESYLLGKSKRMILAGDAAHVFPPAGGFGMNTGLQDSHNLSWRLALLNGQHDTEVPAISGVPRLLLDYERERRHIASINVSLSVRNYNRTLEIAKACYLNAEHPALLRMIMESSPVSLLPLSLRRDAFKLAVRTALKPLAELSKEGTMLGERIVRNVRRILESGGGLPLLFPSYELGFNYDAARISTTKMSDTEGHHPSFSVGSRLPHIKLSLVGRIGQMSRETIPEALLLTSNGGKIKDHQKDVKDSKLLSLTDLESQLSMRWIKNEKPHFLLVVICPAGIDESSPFTWHFNVSTMLANRYNITLDIVEIFEELEGANNRLSILDRSRCDLTVSILHAEKSDLLDEWKLHGQRLFIIVRPDGHIACRETIQDMGQSSEELFYEKIVTNLNTIMN